MKTTLTRLFTVMLLIMVSMGAMADVKVLFGEKGDDKFKTDGDKIEAAYDGGTIVVTQKVVDATKVTVFLTVTPNKGYTMQEKNVIEAYATAPANIGTTRAPLVSEKLTLDCEDFKDETLKRTYTTTIDSKLALWVKSARFVSGAKVDPEPTRNDCSGVYYIANAIWNGSNTGSSYYWYNENTPEYNWYLVPGDDPQRDDKQDAYYSSNYSTTPVATDKPFLTTYRTNRDNNSIWIIKKTGNNYYIIHVLTGKYVKYEPPYQKNINGYSNNNNCHRKAIHLEEWTDPDNDPGDVFKYEITTNTNTDQNITGFNIKYTGTLAGGSNRHFNPAGDNWEYYYGKNDKSPYSLGMVGLWTSSSDGSITKGSLWPYEDAKAAINPTISDKSSDNKVTITMPDWLPAGYNLRYTFGSDDLTASTTPCIENNDGSAKTIDFSEPGTLKVAIERYGMVLSEVVEKTVIKVATPSIITDGTIISISCATDGATIYYTTDGSDPLTSETKQTYEGPLSVSTNLGNTINAIAVKAGCFNSEISDPLLVKATCPKPTISYSNSNGEIALECSDAEATIYYTTNGSEPDPSQVGEGDPTKQYDSEHKPTISVTTTIKAIATKSGSEDSEVASLTITQVATPTIQDNGNNAISITCATEGATIYFTTDGSTPTTSSTEYTEPLTENVSGVTIKAIAVKENMITSEVGSGSVTLRCATPIITRVGMTFTLSCSMPTDATFYYSLDESTPATPYNGPVSFTSGQLPITVYAVAMHDNYTQSETASMELKNGTGTSDDPYLIYSSADFTNFVTDVNNGTKASKCYKLEINVSGSGIDAITTAFTGTFDGGMHIISDLNHALFNTIDGGVVKNVMFDNVNISSGTNVGAIANVVEGTSEQIASIYNCGILSGSVSGSGCVGSLVGLLGNQTDDSKCYARVINCFSYATVGGGSDKGGIVGYNSYASKDGDIRTMVMNCLFLGSIADGANVSPVYGGVEIHNLNGGETNKGLNTYNYYRYATNQNITDNKYNCALAVKDQYLTRFEIYRQLLNSNRKLAAWYATGDANKGVGENNEMAKWVLDRTVKPYPILKAQKHYYSIVNYDPNNTFDKASGTNVSRSGITARNKGKNTGTLTVHISAGDYGSIKTGKDEYDLQRTDKDYDSFNFNYDKVQLPYFNEVGNGNYEKYGEKNRVVTGWKITRLDGGTPGSYTAGSDIGNDGKTPYNFADRKCTNKDMYGTNGSNRVFSQGAYFDVPYGVTDIYIEAYWGQAAFICDEKMDVVYNANTVSPAYVTAIQGNPLIPASDPSPTIHTTVSSALGTLDGSMVYDNALVLVGNLHLNDVPSNGGKAFTIMSADFDQDNEPDYSLIYSHFGEPSGRKKVSPIRFDFLNVPGTAMAQKPKGATYFRNVGIFNPSEWFEITNTCSISFVQFEYDNGSKSAAPLILLGGEFEQFVSTQNKTPEVTQYIHVGSNAYFKEFNNGTHSDGFNATKHIPISVTGGDYDKFYLSGAYRPDAAVAQDNAEGYISGGRFGEVAGAGQQHIDGDVYWQIYDADITDFYGGGVNSEKPVTGNIIVDIFNSHVTTYCGGPKFGNMQKKSESPITIIYATNQGGDQTGSRQVTIGEDRTVTTNADGCTFGNFFGAGYGGIAYFRERTKDAVGPTFSSWQRDYTNIKGNFYTGKGVATDFDYEFFVWSSGKTGGRFYVKYASLSLASTNDVTSILNNCTIKNSFFGGGRLGKVAGNVTSTLTGCTVEGSAFGAGYSADKPTVPYRNGGFTTVPKIDNDAGVFADGVKSNNIINLTLVPGTLNDGESAISASTINTDADLDHLGTVEGKATLNIDGSTLVKGQVVTEVEDDEGVISYSYGAQTGGVFGGGDASEALGDTEVNINAPTTKTEGGYNIYNVFGGGNKASVNGNTTVNLKNGVIQNNVFGGGKGEADEFLCSKAMVGRNDDGRCEDPGSDTNKDKGTKVTISNGTVNGNVYGGGEVGRVEWNTQVKIGVGTGEGPFAPEINGSVFGAGKGKETHGYAALVRGNSSVTIQGNAKVRDNVYGGGEQATVGRYWVKGISTPPCDGETQPDEDDYDVPDEMPYKTRRGGKCTVVVQGNAHVGPNSGATATAGHVFGAGKGVTPNYVHTGNKTNWSKRMVDYNSSKHTGEPGTTWDYYPDNHAYVWEYFPTEAKYLEFLQTLALVTRTDVTINGSAVVKGSVFGGSESGYVQDNTDVKVTGGTIGTEGLGGAYHGNVYGGGKGDAEHTGANHNYVAAGLVKGNTKVTIDDGRIWHNVYGGGAYGSVGEFTYDANGMPTGRLQSTTGGKAEVIITGGTIGTTGEENGMIFGSSRGDVGAPGAIHDKLAWVYNTEVKIGTEGSGSVFTPPTIKGSVYGGGENGHVFNDADVYIYSGTVGIPTGETIEGKSGAAYEYRGNVYGAGCGTDKYIDTNDGNKEKYNPLAGIVQGNTTVNISGGHVVRNVYGAGAMGSVGTASVATSGKTTVTVTGGRIGYDGNSNNDGNIFGAARGDLAATGDLALVRETEVNISYTTTPDADNEDKNVQLIAGSVFGGGEAGKVKGSVAVNMTGGLVLKDVYGGGALADTQTSNWDASANNNAGGWATGKTSASSTTTVRLTGGTILGEAYGGALGQKTGVNGATSDIEAIVYGDVLLDLNGTTTIDGTSHKPTTAGTTTTSASGCAVGQVFGCNNINGSPKGDVMVHVYGTQNKLKTAIADKFIREKDSDTAKGKNEDDAAYVTRLQGILTGKIALAEALSITVSQENKDLCTAENPAVTTLTTAITSITTSINAETTEEINGVRYDVTAVYGGGNMAAYVPALPNTEDTSDPSKSPNGSRTQVIIEGCAETSIETVYGGGNAASVPETNVYIKGAYEIGYLFGGGNGKDDLPNGDPNPGADIGQYYDGTETVAYGTGNANSLMEAGLIHEAYGGSNTKGVIKGSLNQTSDPKKPTDPGYCCELVLEKVVGAGKYADIDGNVNMTLSCQPSSKVPLLFAGADEANVNGNITLNITNGYFGKVFGGNNLGGAVKGKITVNVEETGCQPIKIDELYLGGYEATYSKFGYYIETNKTKDNGTGIGDMANDETAELDNNGRFIFKPRTSATDSRKAVKTYNRNNNTWTVYTGAENDTAPTYDNPVLNITSCTYIGKVFGGGFGEPAKMYADPTVNVNMEPGDWAGTAVPAMMTELGLDVAKTAPNPDNLGILGDVFGGGNAADIVGSTTVNIATVSGKSAYIIGSVFGGGNDADVLGNTNVTMSDGYVFNGIFGGGYAGNVGTFDQRDKTLTIDNFDHSSSTHNCIGKPTHCVDGTGKCTVLVNGGQIGPISVATEGMNRPKAQGGPVPEGWVWGAGQGLVEDPAKEPDTHFSSYVGSTDVTIGGTAFVLESVIGGGEFGRVLYDTKVTITGNCQIGVGEGMVDDDGKPIRYTDDQFVNPLTTTIKSGENGNALAECSHFPYGEDTNNDGIKDTFLPYDPYYDTFKDTDYIKTDHPDLSPASTASPSDGKTWIGCVFAGGSGYMPYEIKDNLGNPIGYDWCSSAGLVERNTELIISGGHILTNVYGGNEVTNVKGKCKVTMTGGTIGVPRTVQQIIDHPLTCYLFGAGKGDPRPHFNTETNVGEVEVEILGGTIYGSVFGGGEDGHVERDVKMTIGKDDHTGPIIGTWGTTYVDGNIFGGGRGFSGDAYTAGNVAGCVKLDIKGGTMLGSIYGGGRLGSVGYGLYPPTAGPTYYGAMRPDNTGDDANNSTVNNFKRGYVEIEISGGTIGNTHEYIIPSAGNTPSSLNIDNIATWTDANWKTWKDYNNIPLTEFDKVTESDKVTYRLKHTKGGNVFAGGMGRLYQLDGKTPISAVDWWKVGCVKQTKLTIKGGTIKSNVYGGGELGAVKPYVSGETVQGGTTEIIIKNDNNTQIGTEVQDGDEVKVTQYTFGSVYGGGYGSTIEYLGQTDDTSTENDNPKFVAGLVHGNTKIDMQGGKVLASVYGGGEVASVNGSADVAVSGGIVGKDKVGTKQFGGPTMGNVYGGGSGHPNIVRCGRILNNTKVTISGADTKIYHNVYGGGAYGTVGEFNYTTGTDGKVNGVTSRKTEGTGTAEVIITGGTIGTDGHENGMVFGSSRGDVNEPGARDDHTAWVYDAKVTIGTSDKGTTLTTPLVKGSVYGSGENGHTFNNTIVNIYSGTVGITDPEIDGGARYSYRGNVYGGGCGTDIYTKDYKRRYNPLAGIVYGTTTVNMTGGHVVHDVFGGGAMGSVGKFTFDANGKPTGLTQDAVPNSGKCTLNISGGMIGMTGMQMTAEGGPDDFGHVFGAGRGEVKDTTLYDNLNVSGYVRSTEVNISGKAFVMGSVYGGAESGHVLGNTLVQVSGGQIGCGSNKTVAYTEDEWTAASPSTFAPCASWTYTEDGAAYDPNAGSYDSKGGATTATDGHTFYGNVFGGGSGYYQYSPGKWIRSAGRVEGNTVVYITGGHILTNVYGGNECTDVLGSSTVNMSGGTVGVPRTKAEILQNPALGYLFGAGKGDKRVLFNTWTNVASTSVNVTGGTIYGSVYGGGEDGHVLGDAVTTINQSSTEHPTVIGVTGESGYDGNVFGGGQGSTSALTAGVVGGNVDLKIQNGQLYGSVYGGGRLASVGTYFTDPNDSNYGSLWTEAPEDHGNISVSLTGGTVTQNVFGGGMGTTDDKFGTAAGLGISRNVTVDLNKDVPNDARGCVVDGSIFGCNNLNTSPRGTVTVHIHKTQNAEATTIANPSEGEKTAKVKGRFDVKAVYGGGNMAAYEPVDLTTGKTEVIIDGCGLTSIRQVYGGGNAASTPATDVTVNGTYEIFELFGGGNGADDLPDGSPNPGANVGYKDYHLVEDQFPTKEDRVSGDAFAEYRYGTGVAAVNIMGGTVHRVFGGSNTKGNVRQTALTLLEEGSGCSFCVDEAYGGGKSAPMDAEAKIHMACIPGLKAAYGGAEAADIQGDVTLNITNGTFERVFGGNNISGTIRGSITVNIEETGCKPIIIGELYGGGNQAGYSVRGYKKVTEGTSEIWKPRMPEDDLEADMKGKTFQDPQVNIKSFTSIGEVYGGGYGEGAVMVGSPTVNINVTADGTTEAQTYTITKTVNNQPVTVYASDFDEETITIDEGKPSEHQVTRPSHVKGKVGAINNVFGGGNAAKVVGDTHVNIGTESTVDFETDVDDPNTTDVDESAPRTVVGADIRGNVYGGGNEAEVTGGTNVTIGKEKVTTP